MLPMEAESSKPYLELRAASLPPKPLHLPWYSSEWLLPEFAVATYGGTRVPHLVHAQQGVQYVLEAIH